MAKTSRKPVVLAVDDSEDVLKFVSAALSADCHVRLAVGGAAALAAAIEDPRPDLILLDVAMPRVDGYQVCAALKADPDCAEIPVIFLTGNRDAASELQGFKVGAIDYIYKPIRVPLLQARVRMHLALIDRRGELERLVRERTGQLETTRRAIIQRLARAMEYHESAAVGNRVLRVSAYARAIAQAAGARPAMVDMIGHAAPLYDVGKLAVRGEILRKRGTLSAPDWEEIRRHPETGANIIGRHDDPMLRLAALIALTHHERWDGAGYPKGLKGQAIPWSGRLIAVVDGFEAMSTTQFHRDALSVDQSAQEVVRGSGAAYDPALVEAFRSALPALREIRERYSDTLGNLLDLDFTERVAALGGAPRLPEV